LMLAICLKWRWAKLQIIMMLQLWISQALVNGLTIGADANESRHSDQNRQFSVQKLAVLTFSKVFSLFIAVQI